MLGGMFAVGFSNRCKSLIKPIRTQIEVQRKGKEATQRFLKNNLAQLIANRHYAQAYEKTDEYIIELNRVTCYDFVEESCEHILKRLPEMQKRSECLEDCIEAVGTLVYAAGKFADIYELRMLRDVFKEKYGKSLERFANQEFVANFASKTATAEKKIKVLEDVASEYTIKWDSSVIEQMLDNPSAFAENGSAQKMANPQRPERKMANTQRPEQKMANTQRPEQKMDNLISFEDPKDSEQKMANPTAAAENKTSTTIPSWDSRIFEQMLAESPEAAQVRVQPAKKLAPLRYKDDAEKAPKDTETLTIIYKRMTSTKDRNELAGDKYRLSIGNKDVNLLESEKLDQRHVRNEDLTRKGRFSLDSTTTEQVSPKRDSNGMSSGGRGKFTQFNNELWEETAAKTLGKRAEFANGRYRRTTIL